MYARAGALRLAIKIPTPFEPALHMCIRVCFNEERLLKRVFERSKARECRMLRKEKMHGLITRTELFSHVVNV